MNKLIAELPENFIIKSRRVWDLEIRDHKIINNVGLLHWFMTLSTVWGGWKKALPQLIQGGFKFEAFVEQCVAELDDPKQLVRLLYYNYCPDFLLDPDEVVKFGKSPLAGRMAEIIKKQILTCKNWDQFYDEMKVKSKFNRYMKCKIRDAIPQVSHWRRLGAKIEFLTTINIRWTSSHISN